MVISTDRDWHRAFDQSETSSLRDQIVPLSGALRTGSTHIEAMAESSSSRSEESKPLDTPLDTWNVEEVKCFVSHHFSKEVASKFEGKVPYFEVALSVL